MTLNTIAATRCSSSSPRDRAERKRTLTKLVLEATPERPPTRHPCASGPIKKEPSTSIPAHEPSTRLVTPTGIGQSMRSRPVAFATSAILAARTAPARTLRSLSLETTLASATTASSMCAIPTPAARLGKMRTGSPSEPMVFMSVTDPTTEPSLVSATTSEPIWTFDPPLWESKINENFPTPLPVWGR